MAKITFHPMDDERYVDYSYVLLLIDNTVYEATYEFSRSWFYLYNRKDFEGHDGLEDHIEWHDERIQGWAPCKLEDDEE